MARVSVRPAGTRAIPIRHRGDRTEFRSTRGHAGDPFLGSLKRGAHVRSAQLFHTARALTDGRIEEAVIARIAVAAGRLVNLDETVGGDQVGILRVEPPADVVLAAILAKPVDPVGDDEERAVVRLGDEVAQGMADGPGKSLSTRARTRLTKQLIDHSIELWARVGGS